MVLDELYPSKFLKASDCTRPLVARIDRVVQEQVGREREMKPVLYLEGQSKGLILNKTNFNKVVTITSQRDTADWPGRAIELYATTCTFGDEEVDCVRIRAPRKPAKATTRPPSEEYDSGPVPRDSDAPRDDDDRDVGI